MTSPVICSGSALTRLKDNLQFVAGDNIGGEDVGKGSIYADGLMANRATTGSFVLASISDGSLFADSLAIYASNSIYAPYGISRASGGNDGTVSIISDITDNTKHSIGLTWEENNLVSILDGVSGDADTTCDMPNDLDTIAIGQRENTGSQTNGLIQNFRIFKKPVKSG